MSDFTPETELSQRNPMIACKSGTDQFPFNVGGSTHVGVLQWENSPTYNQCHVPAVLPILRLSKKEEANVTGRVALNIDIQLTSYVAAYIPGTHVANYATVPVYAELLFYTGTRVYVQYLDDYFKTYSIQTQQPHIRVPGSDTYYSNTNASLNTVLKVRGPRPVPSNLLSRKGIFLNPCGTNRITLNNIKFSPTEGDFFVLLGLTSFADTGTTVCRQSVGVMANINYDCSDLMLDDSTDPVYKHFPTIKDIFHVGAMEDYAELGSNPLQSLPAEENP